MKVLDFTKVNFINEAAKVFQMCHCDVEFVYFSVQFPSLFDTDGYLISRSRETNFSFILCFLSHSQYTDKEILKDSLIYHIFFRNVWLQKEDDH